MRQATRETTAPIVAANPSAATSARRHCETRREGADTLVDCRHFFDDGVPRGESSYKNGQPHGDFRVYYYTGGLRQEHTYVDGLRDGSYKRYYPEGGLAQKYDDIHGTTRKIAQYFYPNGSLLGREELENNRFHGPLSYTTKTARSSRY